MLMLLSTTLFGAVGCSQPQGGTSVGDQATQTEVPNEGSSDEDTKQAYQQAFGGKGLVSTFIGEQFYDQKVTNEDEALAAIKSVYDRIGADDTTELELTAVRPTETGATYYVFNQKAGDVFVFGASSKLITNKDDEVVAVVSSILPKVQLAKAEDWAVSAEEAERIVVKQCEENGYAGVEVVKDSTAQTIIPVPDADGQHEYAWVVYTPNYNTDSEMAYLAHYVDVGGDYLYALPISEPHDADSESGEKANFDFSKFQQNTWKGEVTLHDGTTKEIEVPVLVDPDTKEEILGDGTRKILCADFAQWKFEDTLAPSTSDDETFNNIDLLAYDTFIKVWDFYNSVGWTGPDGEGTPVLLLMNLVDENGKPYDNAFYCGRNNGFQVFAFNRLNPDGENMDIIAHEATHCVTGTTMTTNLYLNDMGSINEGMSDVMGNLIEMILVNKPETAWLIGDSSGGEILRNMKNPHEYRQPEFRWDTYYAPNVTEGTEVNDRGGAHTNSSLLGIVSYRLDQAGMESEDQFYFWMNVAFAMTPSTDYAQMAELLPWCMEQTGYTQYVPVVNKAIEDAAYTRVEIPKTPVAGMGKIALTYPSVDIAEQGVVRFSFIPEDNSPWINTWPAAKSAEVACFAPAGSYYAYAQIGAPEFAGCQEYVYTANGWEECNGFDREDASDGKMLFAVEDGKTIELSTRGLPEQVDAIKIGV